jgi:hypothetical protein
MVFCKFKLSLGVEEIFVSHIDKIHYFMLIDFYIYIFFLLGQGMITRLKSGTIRCIGVCSLF